MKVDEAKYGTIEHVGKELIRSIDLEKREITIAIVDKPKLITGTKISGILGRNDYSSPFMEACSMFRIYWTEEHNRYTRFGNINEPKIRSKVREILRSNDLGFGGRMGVESPVPGDLCYYDHFGYRKRPFGGMVDGYVTKDGERCAVLEVKTSSKRHEWEDAEGRITRVPENYVEQASLYSALTGFRKIVFAVGFAKDEDYENPDAWEATDENTYVFVVDAKDVSKDMADAKAWGEDILRTKKLPAWTDSKGDQAIIRRLMTKVLPMLSVKDERIVDEYIATGDATLLEEIKKAMVGFANFETTVEYTQDGHTFVATKENGSWSIEVVMPWAS